MLKFLVDLKETFPKGFGVLFVLELFKILDASFQIRFGVVSNFSAAMAIEHSKESLVVIELQIGNMSIFHVKSPALHFASDVLNLGIFAALHVDVQIGLLHVHK